MRRIQLAFLASAFLAAASGLYGRAVAPIVPEDPDEKLLRENKVPTEGPGLLDYVRKHFTEVIGEAKLKELIADLGDDSFFIREDASRRLILLGPRAKARLQEALRSTDLEIGYRAAICLKEIEKSGGLTLQVALAAIRVLAQRKPAGAVGVLFSSLPHIDDETVSEEVRQALARLALKNNKAHPLLVVGLKDPVAVKRAAAALALCQVKAVEHLPAIRKLLADPDQKVRVPVALALARMRCKDAVPVLLALMDQPSTRETGLVEDLLFRLAGEKSPTLTGSDAASRKNYRKAWEAWWSANGEKIDLAVLEESARILGRTTVVLLDQGEVVDLDASNRVRWKISDLEMVLDVQRLSGERVLLAEFKAGRVTERNSKGEVLWQKKVVDPLVAQRLANGNTFIANKEELMEVDRTGKVLYTYNRPAGEQIMRARKLPGGDILLVTQLGVSRFVRLDRFRKEIKNFGVQVSTSGGRIDLTPAGNVLIPELHNQRVVEFDMSGKIVRELPVQQPIAAVALPNGHVVVTSMSQNRAVEFDRAGKEVWEYKRDSRVTRAVRR